MRLILLIVGQVIVPVSSGVAIGLVGTRWASGFAEAQLFAVDTTGVTPLASTVAVVLAAALSRLSSHHVERDELILWWL